MDVDKEQDRRVDDTDRPASGLIWGIKSSFLSYLSRLPDVTASVDQAIATPGGGFYFPLASHADYDDATGQGTLRFDGDVRISAHRGMLFVIFARPWVSFEGDRATLSFADPASPATADCRLPMADLIVGHRSVHRGAHSWPSLGATLREEAVGFFNDIYPPGEPMEPVDIRVSF